MTPIGIRSIRFFIFLVRYGASDEIDAWFGGSEAIPRGVDVHASKASVPVKRHVKTGEIDRTS
jgi:hypothetical protein